MNGMSGLRADPLRLAFAAIAAITVLSGLAQLVAPGAILSFLHAAATPTSRHFFATVGMFMAVLGALAVHALAVDRAPRYVVTWVAVQKFGAFAAVSVGVSRHIFGAVALAVAFFDLGSGILGVLLWRRLGAVSPVTVLAGPGSR
jgi:hypothetical protein